MRRKTIEEEKGRLPDGSNPDISQKYKMGDIRK
jgi:hypothetical protein